MKNMNFIYLASQSISRQELLKSCNINFKVLKSHVAELDYDNNLSLNQNVLNIAIHKMENLSLINILPENDKEIYVLTADTLCQDINGIISGKPKDYADAVNKIKALRGCSAVATAYCLDKKNYCNNQWVTKERITEVVNSEIILDIPDQWIDKYINSTIALNAAGAAVIDGFGSLFVKSINGSYSNIIGLDVYKLRQSLEQLNFFKF